MSELKPCPWQMPDEKVHDVRVYDVDEGDSGTIGFTVSCNDCLIDGPQAMAKKRAVELWNRRASPWVRVEDGLPPISEEVLVKYKCQNGGVTNRLAKRVNGFVFVESKKDYPLNAFGYVLAWMPIPEIEG